MRQMRSIRPQPRAATRRAQEAGREFEAECAGRAGSAVVPAWDDEGVVALIGGSGRNRARASAMSQLLRGRLTWISAAHI